MLKLFSRTGSAALEIFFPRSCDSCSAPLFERKVRLCADCARALALQVGGDYCRCCGNDVGPYLLRDGRCRDCVDSRPALAGFARVGRYEAALRDLIVRFKTEPYHDRLLGRMLGELIAREWATVGIDWLVPIPSPWLRRARRGYQPTELLAREASLVTGIPWTRRLEMARRVRPQTGLARKQREINIRGAFRVIPGCDVTANTICVIDDVSTTGATLREAARTLDKAGARQVVSAVLARTPA